jgi:FAD:protein FMN transferase
LMSNYLPDSELSRLNKAGKFRAHPVSKDLYRIIQEALKYSQLSDGEFDITVGPLVNLWKAALAGGHEPSADEQLAARSCIGYDRIRLSPPNRVSFLSDCLRLDLGAIGKGYAVDRAAAILRESGLKAALIDAGGSTIYALGSPPGKAAWLVHMRDPSGHVDPTVMLSDESISTSEQSRPSFVAESSAGHIIDPRTGHPLRTPFATSVVANTATASDALSTTLLLMGPQQGDRLVRKLPDVAAIWIAADGETHSASAGPRISISNHLADRCLSGNCD